MTTLQILQGIKTWVTTKLNLKQDVINDLANIRSGAQAGATAVQPTELSAYFNDASYDSNAHRINFYHGQTVVAYIDASPFIIDGMVDDVRIENGYLVIDFNTASGKQDISIPLTDIFNPNNYYNKTQTDGLLAQKQDVIQDLSTIRSGASAGSTAVQPSTLSDVVKDVVAESGVYDVSANNDNIKFESLSALLSSADLNTLIPTAYRKGGMSIKFVLSSDNKYVQFHLMKNEWSTTVNDWQGVDDVPTFSSKNLVKSGGVFGFVSNFVFGDEKVALNKGKYIPVNQGVGNVCPLTMSDSTLNDCTVINLKKGQIIKIIGVGGNRSRLWAILDKETHVILDVADANSATSVNAVETPFIKIITAENDCIVIVNVYNENANPAYGNQSHTPYSVMSSIKDMVKKNTDDIKDIENYIFGGVVTMTKGAYIPSNQGIGNVCPMEQTASNISDCTVVELLKGQTINIKGVGGNASRLWAILDKETHKILDVANANSLTLVNPFEKYITAEIDCIVVVNVYNENTSVPYGNTSNTPYSVNRLSLKESLIDMTVNTKVFEMTQKEIPTTASLYDSLWDKFVTDNYASRSKITEPDGKPVYCYHIAPYNKIAKNPQNSGPFTITDNDYFSKYKILIISGIHGNEKQTPLWLYEFFNRIIYEPKYSNLRSAFDWYVVPMVNPTGYDSNTRNNYNNVNINRDFARQTQVETQAICNLIDNGDFDMFIDMHQLSGGSGKSDFSPDVCCAFIPSALMSDVALTDLCTKFCKGGAKADYELNEYYKKSVRQSAYVWPPITVSGDDLQSHEYAEQQGIVNSFEFEFTQYAYIYSNSDAKYNSISMVYGNTMVQYLMEAFLT